VDCSSPATPKKTPVAPLVESTLAAPATLPAGLRENTADLSIRVLQVPPATQSLKSFIESFFDALARGTIDGLVPLVAPSALAVDSRGNEVSLVTHWTKRLEENDYRKTALLRPVCLTDIEVLPHDDDRARAVVTLLKPKVTDLLLYVPICHRRYDGQSLFGESVWFQLRRFDDGLRIVATMETAD
jgi:hypothetical protein